jgi:hypothetical protein
VKVRGFIKEGLKGPGKAVSARPRAVPEARDRGGMREASERGKSSAGGLRDRGEGFTR